MTDMPAVIYIIAAVLGGGGVSAIITAVIQNRKVKAEIKYQNAKTQPEIDQLTVGTMTEVIENLRSEYRAVVSERDNLKQQLVEALDTIDQMKVQLEELQKHISDLVDNGIK